MILRWASVNPRKTPLRGVWIAYGSRMVFVWVEIAEWRVNGPRGARAPRGQRLRARRVPATAISTAKKVVFWRLGPSATIEVSRPTAAPAQAKPTIA